MTHSEDLTRYTANFIDQLVVSGLKHVVISPGSRSTPLAILSAKHESITEWVIIDERAAAYFALGIAKQTKRPVALVCTSGTAAANYLPAIIEAYYARVPLLVLTADRPHELRDIGASQTMDQIGMYGNFVKNFYEMALPDASKSMLAYVRRRAVMAVSEAKADNPGPIHLNFPFREPLIPDLQLENLWGKTSERALESVYLGEKTVDKTVLEKLAIELSEHKKGIIVCGPQTDPHLASAITKLAKRLAIPILADPLSQLRSGSHELRNVITSYDSILRNESIRGRLKPDYIIRFGAMPISKNYLFFMEENSDCQQYLVENAAATREPTNQPHTFIVASSTSFCESLLPYVSEPTGQDNWLGLWQMYEGISQAAIKEFKTEAISEGEVIKGVLAQTAEASQLFIANSMPVRDLDTFFTPMEKQVTIHGNRGVSGIDGITSSALGVAATAKGKTTLVVGDLSFYHDLTGLLTAKQYGINLTIVLINNDGGGIFSFLPQAKSVDQFEQLFGTPHNLAFEHAVNLYDGRYEHVRTMAEYEAALQAAYAGEGLTVIEVKTDRTENVAQHRALWARMIAEYELVNA